MPELPEVEVVRRGLQRHLAGRTIAAVRVHHPRAVRRHEAGAGDLTARLLGARGCWAPGSREPTGAASTSGCGWTPVRRSSYISA